MAKYVLLKDGRAYVDAVGGLRCVQGVGNGSGNAAKINNYLDGRPQYPLYIPGGALELDDTIIVPAKSGTPAIAGNGQGAPLNDNSYTGSAQGGSPTRLVWAGAADKAMIQFNARFGGVHDLTLQSRPAPSTEPNNTGIKARLGIHVRTYTDTVDVPVGKASFTNISFDAIPNGMLFGSDLDTAIGTVGDYNNSDESSFHHLHYYFDYSEGYGTGSLTTRTSNTAGVVTLGSSSHGITQGNYCDIDWSGGSRTGMLVTGVSGAAITLSGGYGTNLPSQSTSITSCQEERYGLRFRTHQAVGFAGGKMQVNGHPAAALWFERGSKLWLQELSVSGWYAATHQSDILRLGSAAGGVYPGYYNLGVHLDASSNCVKLLKMSGYTPYRSTVNMRFANSDPTGGSYTLPLIEAAGSCHVKIEDFRGFVDNSIVMYGQAGSGSTRNTIATVKLVDCGFGPNVGAPSELVNSGSSIAPWILQYRDCSQTANGSLDNTGYIGRFYTDGETVSGTITPTRI